MNYELINVESLDINEYKSDVIVESENSPSNASNKAGPSINDTYHYINQSPIKLEKEEIINNVYEKNDLDKYKSTSKLIKGTVNNDLINNLEILNIDEYEHKSGIMMKSENSSSSNTSNKTTEPSIGDTYIHRNQLLLKLENEGFITPDEKVKELVKELTEPKFLYALKLLFENLQNKFSSKILISSLNSLADPNLFKYYSEENVVKLELHLRAWIAVLERIHFSPSPIVLSKDLLDEVCNSLAKFAEVYYEAIQVVDKSNFNQQRDNRYNYNIDFLLIYLRDTLHGLYNLYDDSTWFQELLRKIKDLLNIILSSKDTISDENYSILLMITQLRKELSFKYSVPSYYIDLRIMLIIQHNLFIWSEDSEKIISKKFAEMLLMEHIWSFLEREWDNVADKSILDSQVKFDIVSKSLKNNRNFLNKNNFTGNEPLALPHTLWFGLLDIAQNLIQKSTRKATYGLCYYLAIESLNKAPSNFIQFKAIEILLNLHNINDQMFSMIEDDFDQYIQKLNEDNLTGFSEKFQTLLRFVKEKYFEDYKIINDIGKGKGKGNNQISKSYNIIDIIADEITCSISSEPTDQLCILKCQHILSLNNLKKLKQKKCPQCREKLENNDIRYLPQNTIYKNLYSQFFGAGHILPTIELENSEPITNDQYDNDSADNLEVDLILTKKKKFMKVIKLNSNILSSILPRISKKQHPLYQNIIKELDGKYYQKTESLCKEFLELFPKSYSVRCILAYIYRCLKNYEQAQLYLKEAIELKPKKSIAYFIYGELLFWQSEYEKAINNLNLSLECKVKSIVSLRIILGNSFLGIFDYDNALNNYHIVLENISNNNLCLKNCAYIYERQKDYINCLKILEKLLNINDKDSLILCYCGEILCNMGYYDIAISYFTKASNMDPENIHNLNKRAMAYFVLQEYNKAILDLDKVIQLDPSNSLAHYNKGITYYTLVNIKDAEVAFKKCVELDSDDNLSRIQLYYMKYLQYKNSREDDLECDYVINQIPDIEDNNLLLFIRCTINIEFKNYDIAMSCLSKLFYNYKDISFIYLLQKYQDFWSYLYYKNHDAFPFDYTRLRIINKFNRYMYDGKRLLYLKDILFINS
jgi:Tfp pilus assembly protein PilF